MADAKSVLKLIKDKEVKFVDLRFTDPRGKWQHVTFDLSMVDEDLFAGQHADSGIRTTPCDASLSDDSASHYCPGNIDVGRTANGDRGSRSPGIDH